ncbi:MAG: 3'-5' exonuclease [Blastomonas sp.]
MNRMPNNSSDTAGAVYNDELTMRILLPAAKLKHFIVRKEPVAPLRVVAVVDVEATGTDPLRDQIIDLAYVMLLVDRDGDIVSILAVREALCDPMMPIPARVTKLTGLSDADVLGKAIDLDLVEEDFRQVDVFIAHNARFDAAFIRQLLPSTAKAAWACSLNDFDWLMDAAMDGRALGHLLAQAGFYNEGHRALADVISLIHLLAYPLPLGGPMLGALIANAERQTWRIEANRAPFSAKDLLKARGYNWDSAAKVWWTEVADHVVENEELWLSRHVLPNGPTPRKIAITWHERHR